MNGNEHIGKHIVNYLLEVDNNGVTDPILIEWLAQHESNREKFNQYKKIWDESVYYMEPGIFNADHTWEKINKLNRQKERFHRRLKNIGYTVSGIAASILLMLALSLTGIWDKEQNISVCMKADYGNRSEILLPDGSTVQLNSGSDVTYTYNAEKKMREVIFQGEGFFNVSKSNIPFVIKMHDGVEVKVLGTSFNLKAYADDSIIQASLVTGRIELEYHHENLIMKAGEMVEFDKQTNQLKQINGNLSHSYGWLKNKIYMDNMSLTEVCKHLERWYNVSISIQEGLGENTHYNGVIQEETITDVMKALSHSSNIAYRMKGKNISITSKK